MPISINVEIEVVLRPEAPAPSFKRFHSHVISKVANSNANDIQLGVAADRVLTHDPWFDALTTDSAAIGRVLD